VSETLAVLSSVIYGAADFLGGLASRRASVLAVIVISQASGLLVVSMAIPLLPPASPIAADLGWGAAAGVCGLVGLGLLYRALATGTMSLVAPITAAWAAIVPVAAGVALGERLHPLAVAGIVLALVAIVLVSQAHPEPGRPPSDARDALRRSLGLAVSSGVVIGFFLVAMDFTRRESGLWPLVAARIASLALAGPYLFARGVEIPRDRPRLRLILGSGFLDMVANILFLLAVQRGMLSIVATLTSLYPASTVVLARIVLGERLRPIQAGGVVCALAAVLLIVSGRS
jgi:drug/metabolite transporter (DMT)-like permease